MWPTASPVLPTRFAAGTRQSSKRSSAVRRRAHAELVGDLLAEREARRALLDDEQREAPRAAAAGLRVDEEDVAQLGVADGAVGDPHLGAVQHPAVAIGDGGRLHREDVRPHRRLAHAHAADPAPGAGVRQDARALLVVAVHRQVVHEQHRVREVREGEARVGGGQLLVDDHGGDRVHACAAEALRDRDAEDAQVAQAAEEREIEGLAPVRLGRLRVDLPFCELADRLAQRAVLVGGGEEVGHAPRSTRRLRPPPRRPGCDSR